MVVHVAIVLDVVNNGHCSRCYEQYTLFSFSSYEQYTELFTFIMVLIDDR